MVGEDCESEIASMLADSGGCAGSAPTIVSPAREWLASSDHLCVADEKSAERLAGCVRLRSGGGRGGRGERGFLDGRKRMADAEARGDNADAVRERERA